MCCELPHPKKLCSEGSGFVPLPSSFLSTVDNRPFQFLTFCCFLKTSANTYVYVYVSPLKGSASAPCSLLPRGSSWRTVSFLFLFYSFISLRCVAARVYSACLLCRILSSFQPFAVRNRTAVNSSPTGVVLFFAFVPLGGIPRSALAESESRWICCSSGC